MNSPSVTAAATAPESRASDFLAGGGDMGARIRAFDWSATPLGPPHQWPHGLKTAVRIMLTSRQPIWIGWGKDLTYLYNDAYKSIIGGKHPVALGQPTAIVWREIWDDIGPMLATALQGVEGTYVEQQLLIMERNGYPEETYYTFSYSPVPDDAGGVGGIICANSDDTGRVTTERQLVLLRDLAASTAQTRTWQEACARGAAALGSDPQDLTFALIYLAEPGSPDVARAALCGIDPSHAAAPLAMRADDSAAWPFDEVLRTQNVVILDDLATRFDGGLPRGPWPRAPRRAVLLPIAATGETGRPGVLIVGLNPFRLFDDAYRDFLTLVAGQLAGAIVRTEAYEGERRRAEALAELDRAKTAFFSNVSHEFRTPLTLMMTPIEELLARPGDAAAADARPLLHIAHRNATRLLKLVNTLLEFSRIEAGRVQASFEATDLAAFTADLASNFTSAMQRAGLRFKIDCPPLPQPVHIDREMWEKVVLNLLSNAFKFTFTGTVTVSVRTSPDGSHAQLTVRDSGTGIAPHELPHLFERFRRIEGARGRSYEGSGIGLALVQELVQLHGGQIAVDSTLGAGSTFRIGIPFGTAHLAPEHLRQQPGQVSTGVRAQAYAEEAMGWLSADPAQEGDMPPAATEDIGAVIAIPGAAGRLILLADDNADMRHYMQRMLRAAGLRVEAVADGEAALAAARRLKPDLILSDIMMPRLDGFGLLAAVRAEAALRETPVLLLSARAGEDARLEGLDAGADDYITKPFSARELLARVEVNLRLSGLRQESARVLREEAQTLEKLNSTGSAIAAEIDLDRAVQIVTDAATELTGAAFGSFFYNVVNADGEAYTLYALSGVPREAFSRFPMPRNTAIFGPTFRGEGIVRSPDITKDPRFGLSAPYHGMPEGHLPVRSYLAAPVISQSREVIGGLFFGHPETGMFDARDERLVAGIAAQAALAIDKARLYRAAQDELAQRRRTEAALRESEQSLERKVAERTAALSQANESLRLEALERERAEDALRQSQKMESIGQLTGGVAHDFNNLLTVVIGNLETMQRHLRSPTAGPGVLERSAEQAMRGAQRAATLTQRLLAFSRQQPLDPRPIEVGRLVSGMSDLLRRTIGEQIAVETVLAGGLWNIHADPNQLELAILNLTVNARDAMPGGGKLTIETANAYLDDAYVARHAEVLPGQYVVVAITDNGAGMSRETLNRAFEPFFTTKGIGQGTGLGLSQVYGFVKQSGGHVKLYSELGEGTTVKIYLPRLRTGERAAEAEAEPSQAIPGAARMETVLVVEDDDDVRAHTTGILRELGYRVLEAASGKAALRLFEQEPQVDLLFSDVGLPDGMNGRQLADAIRALRPDQKVLFTTGYARNAIVHDGRLDAGVQLITKPFTFATLAAKLRDVLDARPATRRILVVEDEALVQMLLVESLEELGFTVETAGSATEALNQLGLTQGEVDAAIVDMGLPDRRGDSLVAELRVLYPHLPIVISSGGNERQWRDLFGTDPRIAYLGKPFSIDQLSAVLASLKPATGS